MLSNSYASKAVRKFLIESDFGIVDMELVEYICSLHQSGISPEEFKDCLTKLFIEYNKEQFLDERLS